MGPRDKERDLRLRFIPVVPEKDDNFGISDEERADYKDHLAAGINVMAGYGTVFFVRPRMRGSTPASTRGLTNTNCVTRATAPWCWTSSTIVR